MKGASYGLSFEGLGFLSREGFFYLAKIVFSGIQKGFRIAVWLKLCGWV